MTELVNERLDEFCYILMLSILYLYFLVLSRSEVCFFCLNMELKKHHFFGLSSFRGPLTADGHLHLRRLLCSCLSFKHLCSRRESHLTKNCCFWATHLILIIILQGTSIIEETGLVWFKGIQLAKASLFISKICVFSYSSKLHYPH